MSIISQRSFAGGELAPALYGRVDAAKYATGLRTLRNNTVMRSGGSQNRAGSMFVGEVKDSTKEARAIPFIFNSEQAYILEFGDESIRFIRDGAYITEGGFFGVAADMAISHISNQNPALVRLNTVVAFESLSEIASGDEIIITGVSGMTELNNRNFKVANLNTGGAFYTFELKYLDGTNVDSSAFAAYVSGGVIRRVVKVTSPYDETEIFDVQYTQSADVMTLVHPGYVPKELRRSSDISWALTDKALDPDIAAPTSVTNTGAAGSATVWRIIAVAADGEESYSGITQSADAPSSGSPITVSWTASATAVSYKIYRRMASTGAVQYRLIGETSNVSFVDNDPATAVNEFPSTFLFNGDVGILGMNASEFMPSCVAYFQQRQLFANDDGFPENAWASRVGHFGNFFYNNPVQSDDAFSFQMVGRQVNEIRHLVDLQKLVLLTSGGEYIVEGDESGILSPTGINIRQFGYNGAAKVRPVIIGGNLLYVQARGSAIRDMQFQWQSSGYNGNDLTIFSSHLFDGYTIVDLAYQQIPDSILWGVRSDGVLLGVTYIPEQQMLAWHRHDFHGGEVKSVAVIPEGTEDAVYVIVERTIDGVQKKYMERLSSRFISDIVDAKFLDSYLTYDGRNTVTAKTMTLSGGTNWDEQEDLTLTCAQSFFASTDIGKEVHLTGVSGDIIRCSIIGYTSATVVTVNPNRTVPAAMRSTAISQWSLAVSTVTGLWHLEDEDVSVFADGYVVASPLNSQYATLTVADGELELPQAYGVIHVGLPYVSDLETLDIDVADAETLSDKKKIMQAVTLNLYKSRGIWCGNNPGDDSLDGLQEPAIRDAEGYDEPVDLFTGNLEVAIESHWNSNGRILVRQVDPIPLSILSVSPAGMIPFRR